MSDTISETLDAEGPAEERPKDAATNAECTLTSDTPSEEAEDSFNPFDEVQESVNLGPLPIVIAADGMPTIAPIDPDYVPPLSTETLVCMGDFSKFVVRDSFGFVVTEFSPDRVERAPTGEYFVLLQKDRDEPLLPLFKAVHLAIGVGDPALPCRFVVDPIRPPCRHYVRKQMPMEEAHDHRYVYRLCSARRTTEGTFMSVGNTAVWACSMREPRDVASEKVLDDFDAQKVKEGQERSYHSIFNLAPGASTPRPKDDADSLIKNAGLGSLGSKV